MFWTLFTSSLNIPDRRSESQIQNIRLWMKAEDDLSSRHLPLCFSLLTPRPWPSWAERSPHAWEEPSWSFLCRRWPEGREERRKREWWGSRVIKRWTDKRSSKSQLQEKCPDFLQKSTFWVRKFQWFNDTKTQSVWLIEESISSLTSTISTLWVHEKQKHTCKCQVFITAVTVATELAASRCSLSPPH